MGKKMKEDILMNNHSHFGIYLCILKNYTHTRVYSNRLDNDLNNLYLLRKLSLQLRR